ncbi:MAG: class I SAM-dependent methyltransferase [Pseudohongiellaceae bacterium]
MLDGFDSDRNWRFSVADYCKAPLLLAENYARKHQVSVKTICTDLAAFTSEDRYDMVFVFSTLCFMDANARKAFLESAAERLTADGKIICVARYFENPPRIAQETNSWETRMQRRVRSRFKDFPELIPALGEILTRLAVTRRNAMLAQPNLEDLKRDFKAVGLSIQSSTDIPTHHRVIKDVFHTQKKSLLVLSRDD